ncbi:cytoplasmic protein [Salmonella enterica subsp. enterica serovar Typhimurium]|uniref:cytoplasmic protein n=1 Tax=Salmonella enterica TaxID=28901 RepID=UPI00109DCB8B|nr:cytoplasmic protein [Salmonella enterica]EAZ9869562.1 cytoplasmic protein [Salmonella enterica subsp. enterica serovar Typhimurium]EBJ1616175.1 cytoplasmic protein [Salmonella enterica]ECB1790116.1 cytoplasmic protein [Salmonella enterica subsp. enterica serovar Typhimurium]EDG6499398.1 cytoplasmic protein [Salmonella enterica subsp. enterica serovar Typhimurium]MDY2570387.1 cytoplasmic protein [Salmonella enterica subsp. enterica serovar Typhimurium]
MDAEFQKQGLTDLTETDLQAVVTPGETLRLLHVLREKPEAFSLSAASYEEDTSSALKTLLVRTGFTIHQIREMRLHLIRWQLISQEEYDRE